MEARACIGTAISLGEQVECVTYCSGVVILATTFMSKFGHGMQYILRLLQRNLFDRRDLMPLLRGDPPKPATSPLQTRLLFA